MTTTAMKLALEALNVYEHKAEHKPPTLTALTAEDWVMTHQGMRVPA